MLSVQYGTLTRRAAYSPRMIPGPGAGRSIGAENVGNHKRDRRAAIALYEKLITKDEVDLVLGPDGINGVLKPLGRWARLV